MSRLMKKLKELFPAYTLVLIGILLFGIAVSLLSRYSTAFADFWTVKVATAPRAALAYLTNLFPFSIAESMMIILPLVVVCLIVYACKNTVSSWTATGKYIITLISVVSLVYSMLLINFSSGYYTTPLEKRLEIDRRKVSAQELYDTGAILLSGAAEAAENVTFIYKGFSVMPYNQKELNKKLNAAYDKICDKYDFISDFYSNPKPVALSEPWTYTHIAGVYTFFTGEANININFPDYTLPFTTAHEMAHQRGIAREDEANFVAFLVCMESDDDYIKYSGYVNMYEYISSPLYGADKELYSKLTSTYLINDIRYEMRAYSAFFEQYRENVAATVSGKVNDAYLQSQGQKEGTKSYGLVVDLCVAYYIAN